MQSIRLWVPDEFLRNPDNRPILFLCGPHTWWDRILEVPIIERYRLDSVFSLQSEKALTDISLQLERGSGRGNEARQPSIFVNCNSFSDSKEDEKNELKFNSEVAVFLQNSNYTVLPMTKKIVFKKLKRPEVFIEIGPPVSVPGPGDKPVNIDFGRLESAYRRTCKKLFRRIAQRDFSEAILHLAPRRVAG